MFWPSFVLVPLGADGVNLVDKDDRRRVLLGHAEELAHELWPITEVLLNQLASDDAQEGGRGLVGDGLGEERLAGARGPVQNDALGRLDAHLVVELGVRQGKLDGLLDLLDLRIEAADVGVRLARRLFELHDRDHRVGIVGEHTDDRHRLVVQQHGARGEELLLVDEAHDAHVVLGPERRRDNRVVVVDQLLERPDAHRRPAQIVHLDTLLLGLFIARLEALLVRHKLFLHQQKVVDPLCLEQL